MREKKVRVWEAFQNMADIGTHRIIANTEDCVVIRLENDTGEGDMILYRVFDGIYLMYKDFHMAWCASEFQAAESMLAVDYCREGCLVMERADGCYLMKQTGDVCIDTRVHHKGINRFPGNHFHGITIGFESELAVKSLAEDMKGIPVDIGLIREKFCRDDKPFMIRDDEYLKRLFTDLYQVPEKIRMEYYRTKILELLIYLTAVEIEDGESEKTYFYKDQVEKINAIEKQITSNLQKTYTINELAGQYDISQTALKECFRSIYGKPISTYLRQYRIEKAAELLVSSPELSIGDIAFMVGYESGGKFSAAFKKQTGLTPKEYRRQPY